MNKTRVYLFTGFLESGKSSFIQDTLLEQGFGEDEKTLIIACEEQLRKDWEEFQKNPLCKLDEWKR